MSTAVDDRLHVGGVSIPFHWLAVASAAVLVWSYVNVLYYITNVTGLVTTNELLLVVGGSVVGGALLARKLPVWTAALIGSGLLAVGLFGYYTTVPGATLSLSATDRIVADNVALLTGYTILGMENAGIWALAVAPGAAFVPTYLVFRRRYVLTAAAGGAVLGFFVLTGNAGSFTTLAGVLGALGVVAFGTFSRYGGSIAQLDVLVVALVAMILLSTTVSVVPGGQATPILPSGGGGGSGDNAGLISSSQRISVQGSIDLSPKVQYTVEANRAAYWRVGAYDRYTGSGWIRTGQPKAYEEQPQPSDGHEVRQTITVRAERSTAMPAAWKPVRVVGDQKRNTRLSSMGDLLPKGALTENESYSVVSRVPTRRPAQLRDTGTDYPGDLKARYTQLPGSTSNRLKRKTAEITSDAKTPYAKAAAIEQWLEANKEYSLKVNKPKRGVADSFVFEMEKGYCVYYATSMVVMLRSQGVPARLATGYSPGQRVSEDKWVVRGLDSHAWVEVYFPDVGWVWFDPTPGGERQAVEQQRVEEAREENVSDVDTSGSENGTWTPTTTTTETTTTTPTPTDKNTTTSPRLNDRLNPDRGRNIDVGTSIATTNATTTNAATTADTGGGVPISPPSKEQSLYGALLAFGVLVAARRTGVLGRTYRAVWMRWQPRTDPETDVERAFNRLEHYLGRKHRTRRPGETPREYLTALSHVGADERAKRVGALYEQARYAGDVTETQADEAVSIVDDLVRGRKPA